MSAFEKGLQEAVLPDVLINQQLERIFSDPHFASSDILKRFLSFVVQEALAGRAHTIKEYTIGVKVLDKPVDFKPQQDAIVRIHAGRLRRALHHYYRLTGAADPIHIAIPKGSYVPTFDKPGDNTPIEEELDEPIISVPEHKPIVVAVLPFRHYEDDPSRVSFIEGLGEYLSAELARFQDISVIAYYTMRHMPGKITDIKDLEPALGVQYAVTGSIQFQAGNIRIHVVLIDVHTSEKVWSQMYEHKYNAKNIFAIQDDIVRQVMAVLSDYCGLIVRHLAKASGLKKTNDLDVYNAILWYYHFHSEFSPEAFHKALKAMEKAVQREPDYAMAWGCLSELYLNAYLFNHTIEGNVYERGLECARKAIRLDPHCQNAYVALALAYTYLHRKKECHAAIEHCIALNPGAITLVGMVGFLFICSGEHERGFELVKKSIQLNRFYPPWFNGGIAFYYLIHKDFEQAYYWAKEMNLPGIAWDYLLPAAILPYLGRTDEARMVLAKLVNQHPDFLSRTKEYVDLLILNEELVGILLEGLSLAGLPKLAIA